MYTYIIRNTNKYNLKQKLANNYVIMKITCLPFR